MKNTNKKIIKRIAIIGLGLIGASLAKALKSKYEIIGFSKSKITIDKAINQKLIKRGFTKLSKNALLDVDLIFICTPLSLVISKIKELSKIIDHEVIVTDVGSTKSGICDFAKKCFPSNFTFIGGHPMAGNEFSGIDYADGLLFRGAAWVLTPDENQKLAISKLSNVIKVTGAKVIISNPEEHDSAAALISHLPILISSSLCSLILSLKDKNLKKLAETLASSGFRDTTRVAGGNFVLNSDLLTLNRAEISKILPLYINEMKNIVRDLKNTKQFNKISTWRSKLYDAKGKNINLQ